MPVHPETPRKYLGWGTGLLPLGIALAATAHPLVGSFVTVVAWAVLIAGLHSFGRTGADEGE